MGTNDSGQAVQSGDLFCECDTFTAATKSGTDAEGFGPCFSVWDGKWDIGCDLPIPRFCPWCGRRIRGPQNTRNTEGGA